MVESTKNLNFLFFFPVRKNKLRVSVSETETGRARAVRRGDEAEQDARVRFELRRQKREQLALDLECVHGVSDCTGQER